MKATFIGAVAITLLAVTFGSVLTTEALAETRDSITQYGITWTFAEPAQTGQYAPYFDHVDRWCKETESANDFVWAMCLMYRDRVHGIGADVQGK